jgi:hypothetical protein
LREQKEMQRCRRPGRRTKCSTARRVSSRRNDFRRRNVTVRGCSSAGRVTPPPAVARAPHTYHHRAVGRRACMCRPRPLWPLALGAGALMGPGRRHQLLLRRCRQPAISVALPDCLHRVTIQSTAVFLISWWNRVVWSFGYGKRKEFK